MSLTTPDVVPQPALAAELKAEARRLGFDLVGIAAAVSPAGFPSFLDWLHRAVPGFGRWQRLLAELDTQASTDLAMLSVAVRSLALLDASHAAAA